MKRYATVLVALMVLAGHALGQQVKLPAEVRGAPGSWIVVVPESKDGGEVKWKVGKGLDLVPIDKLFPGQKSAGVVVTGKAGVYEVWAWNAKGDTASEIAVTKVVIGDAPDPGPDPKPPDPPVPPPVPSGEKWLIICWESMDKPLSQGQHNVTTSTKIRQWVRANLTKQGGLKDGEFIMWDKDTTADGYPKEWQDRWPKYRDKMKAAGKPMMFYSDGKQVHELPLPDSVDAAMEVFTKNPPQTTKPIAPEGKGHH